MKRAEVQLPDTIYQPVEGLAAQLHLTVPESSAKPLNKWSTAKASPGPNRTATGGFPRAAVWGCCARRWKTGACWPTILPAEAR